MKALTVLMEEEEFNFYGSNKREVAFSELKKDILAEQGKKAMDRCLEIAQQTGLSDMNLNEIDEEIRKMRSGA